MQKMLLEDPVMPSESLLSLVSLGGASEAVDSYQQEFESTHNQEEAEADAKTGAKIGFIELMNALPLLDPETRKTRSTESLIQDYRTAETLLSMCTSVDNDLDPAARLYGTLHARLAVPENTHKIERAERVELEILSEHSHLREMKMHAERFAYLYRKFGPRLSPSGPWLVDQPSPNS